MSTKLSICIPTYNFGNYIGEALESIIPQLQKNMEIVVLDGGSTDQTSQVVSRFQQTCPQLHYVQQNYRGGIDKDLHSCVQNAKGEYCWLFSADDVMEKNAIETVLPFLKKPCDVCLCNFSIYDLQIKQKLRDPAVLNFSTPKQINLSDEENRKYYFKQALTTFAFFNFLSINIVRRDRWISTDIEPKFFDSWWGHVARIFSMIPEGLIIQYLPYSLVKYRSCNDSFLESGYLHRFTKAFDSYHSIGDFYFGYHSVEAKSIRKNLRKDITLKTLIRIKSYIRNSEEKEKFKQLIKKYHIDSPFKEIITRFVLFMIPQSLIPLLKRLDQFKKSMLLKNAT